MTVSRKLLLGSATVALLLMNVQTSAADLDAGIVETYGSASAYLQPDRVSIDLGVEERSRTSPAEAYAGLARRLDEIKRALERSGVDLSREVTTRDLTLHAQPGSRRNQVGSRPSPEHIAQLSMTIERPLDPDDTESASRFVSQVLGAGATGFRGLTFKVNAKKRLETQHELEMLALDDARKRAAAIAEQSFMFLGDPVRIVVGPSGRMSMGRSQVRSEAMAMSSAASPDIGIHTGQGAMLTVAVQVTYRIWRNPRASGATREQRGDLDELQQMGKLIRGKSFE